MKNKRRIMSVGLTIAILGTSFMVGSGVEIDPVLATAEEAAKKLFVMGEQKNELIIENPNKENGAYVYANYLQGLDGNEDYIIAQRDCGGYAIFEKESMEIIEYSSLGNSPYSNIKKEDTYYAGPINYYKKEKGEVKNIHTGKSIKKEKLSEVAKKIKDNLADKR